MGRNLIHQYPVPKYQGDINKWSQDLEIWLERLQTDADNAALVITNNTLRLAIVKTVPGAVADVSVYLDNTVDPGPIADVTCEISGGTALNSAVPRLESGDKFFVSDATGGWRSVVVFQATGSC